MGMQYWNLYINESDKTNASGNSDDYGAYGELAVLLSHYVKKEKGKGLSTNDFTDSDKAKLESIEDGANINKIESISVNNEPQFIDQYKNVNLCIPTKLSEFQNDVPYAVNIESSKCSDYADSYVGKAKTAFEQEQTLCIGKNANASNLGIAIGNCAKANCRNGDIAIGNNVCTCGNYTINIGDKLKYNTTNSIWEGKVTNASCADVATKNANGTNLTLLDTLNEGLENEICQRWYFDNCLSDRIDNVVGKMVCVYDVCDNNNYPLALCTSTQTIGKSCECSLTFNACCGVLCSPIVCGQINGFAYSENNDACNTIYSCSRCNACNLITSNNNDKTLILSQNIIEAKNGFCNYNCIISDSFYCNGTCHGCIAQNTMIACGGYQAYNYIVSCNPKTNKSSSLSMSDCYISLSNTYGAIYLCDNGTTVSSHNYICYNLVNYADDNYRFYNIFQSLNKIDFKYCDRANNCSINNYICYDGTTSFTSKDTVCFNGCTYSQACTDIRNGLATCTDLNSVSNRVGTIESYIPNQTSTTNQLADKSFVNSSIQTASSNFRGNYSTWANVPSSENDYPTDYAGSKTPTTNDYLVVEDASDYRVENPLLGTWRFKYTGKWSTNGKNGWLPEYQVNEEPFTSEQLYAINSGITCDKVTAYDNHLSNTSNPHNVTKTQVGLGNVDNTKDSDKSVKNSTCFNGCTFAQACTTIRSGLTSCVGTVTSICIACCTSGSPSSVTSSGTICLSANAFNQYATIDTTNTYKGACCVGTVTQVKVGTTAYNPTSGVISLPAYPTINDKTITIQKNSTNVGSFTLNQTENCTINISVPTKVSDLTNDSGFTTCSGTVTSIKVYCGTTCKCEITSSGSICLGSNAFNSTAFTTCTGTVTQVKVGTTAYNPSSGVVSLPAYPTVPTKVSDLTNDSGFTTCTGSVSAIKLNNSSFTVANGTATLTNFKPDSAKNADCFNGCTYECAKTDIRTGTAYNVTIASPSNTVTYALIDLGHTQDSNVIAQVYNAKFIINKSDSAMEVIGTSDYGIKGFANLGSESSPSTCIWIKYNGYRRINLRGSCPISVVCTTTTTPSGITFTTPKLFGSNAFNSTAFTTCKGTVTSVNVSVNGKSGTAVTSSGTVTLTDVGAKHTQVCSSADRKILFASSDIATSCYCGVYFSDGTNGCPFTYNPDNGELKTPKVTIGKGCATMQYNSTTQAIEFIFA